MRLTLWLDARRPWPELRARGLAAEEAGWDALRFGDVPGEPGGRECWAVAGALAAAVPRVGLEVVIRDEVGRHPAVVAKLASTVDQLSGGRLLLGWIPADDPEGEARCAEACHVVKLLADHATARATFAGRFYHLRDAPLDPKPLQQPFPVMLVGVSPSLAAQQADHWSLAGAHEHFRDDVEALAAACQAIGRDRSQIKISATATNPNSSAIEPAIAEWVIPDTILAPDKKAWPEELTNLRQRFPQ